MPIKILLQLGEEEIMTLDRIYNFSHEQERQLKQFEVGQGMLINNGEAHWPIQWRPARCGLGLGDETWRDRYAENWGARVIKSRGQLDRWKQDHADREVYINTRTGRLNSVDVDAGRHPDLGEWFLLASDLFDPVQAAINESGIEPPEKLDPRIVDAALEARRDTAIPSDLSLERNNQKTQRELRFTSAEEANDTERQAILDQYGVPSVLEAWVSPSEQTREKRVKILTALRAVRGDDRGDIDSLDALTEASGIPRGTIGRYNSDDQIFNACLEKQGGTYRLTPVGVRAVDVDWDRLDDAI